MTQTITRTQIRKNVVSEAITRAARECLFLFVYEYRGTISDNTVWATLLEEEPPPKDSLLLCTINPNGVVEWKIDDPDLIQSTNPKVDQTLREMPMEKQLLIFIVEFCSERLEWFCGGCFRDSAEVVWLENARSHLGYPPLDFTRISFADQPPSTEQSQPMFFVIQSREVGEDGEWEEWGRDTDPADLLRAFVNSVSSEEIDDVNRYWRVRETPDPDNLDDDTP